MSTIQTSINLIHLQAGLSLPSVTQRTSNSTAFAANAITVSVTDEVIPLGDVTTPKQVMVKLVADDPVLIGLDGTNYPFELVAADESIMLRLAVESIVEITEIGTLADVAGSLNDKYFTLHDRNGEVKVVITTDGITSITSSGRVVVVTIATNATNSAVATAILAAFDGDAEYAISAAANVVRFTDKHTGTRTNAGAGDSGFAAGAVQNGAASPVIHLKSTGTSQVVVAVAPH